MRYSLDQLKLAVEIKDAPDRLDRWRGATGQTLTPASFNGLVYRAKLRLAGGAPVVKSTYTGQVMMRHKSQEYWKLYNNLDEAVREINGAIAEYQLMSCKMLTLQQKTIFEAKEYA